MTELITLLTFLASSMLIYQALKYYTGKQRSIYRIRKYTNVEEIREEKKKAPRKELKAGLSAVSKGIGSLKFLESYKKCLQVRLNRGQILLKAEEFITIRIALFILPGAVFFLLQGSIMVIVLCMALGWLIPGIIVKSKIKKRIKHLNEQLGDAIMMITNSLRAGYSFFQAIDIVSKEMTGPIAEEFTLLQREINLGLTTEKALENLAQRVESDDLELIVTAVLIQRQTGGNLAEVLENISSTIRDRVKIKGEVRTLTSQGRMSGLIISLLPPVLSVIIYLINPGHIMLLFTEPLGLAIIGFSIMMEMIGFILISKIIKIEV